MKKILGMALSSIFILSSSLIVSAAELDITNIKTGDTNSFYDLVDDQDLFFDVLVGSQPEYVIEMNGNHYKVSEIIEATKDGSSAEDAIKDLKPVPTPEPTPKEFKVIDIT